MVPVITGHGKTNGGVQSKSKTSQKAYPNDQQLKDK